MHPDQIYRERAEAVFNFINTHPDVHDQDYYVSDGPDAHDLTIESLTPESEDFCGTTMCIAGTAAFLQAGSMKGVQDLVNQYDDWGECGADLLGLDHREADAIFNDMDETRALQKLKKVVVGEPLNDADLYGPRYSDF